MSQGNHRDVAILHVNERRTLGGDGEVTSVKTVHCERRGGHIDAEICFACEHCNGPISVAGRPALVCTDAAAAGAFGHGAAVDVSLRTTLVTKVMTPTVLCVREDVTVETAMSILLAQGLGALPVVDAQGHPVGMVTKADLVRASRDGVGEPLPSEPPPSRELASHDLGNGFHVDSLGGVSVQDAMTPLVFFVPETASVGMAAALMAHEGVHHVPVLDGARCIVGILSSLDVLRWFARAAGFTHRR
jgi:CBS domain-containing protein